MIVRGRPGRAAMISGAWLFSILCIYPENIIFNPGFELGSAGYQCRKYVRPDTNPELQFEGPEAG